MAENNKEPVSPQEQKPVDVSGMTAIVIDDDPSSLELMKRLLEHAGFAVRTAPGGKAGLKAAEMTTPNVIVFDVLMPELDGLALFKKIQEHETLCKVPVLIVSARKNMEDSFMALGADAFLPKPVDSDAFIKKVTTLALTSPAPAEPVAENPPAEPKE